MKFNDDDISRLSKEFGEGIPGLDVELKAKLTARDLVRENAKTADFKKKLREKMPEISLESIIPDSHFTKSIINPDDSEIKSERIILLENGARPVARIRGNSATTEFLGVGSVSWANVIIECKRILDAAIPTVGRVELTNAALPWAGTGWLISDDIVVTNAHVAEEFAMERGASKFVFRPGLISGFSSCKLDFLEEEGRAEELNCDVLEVLYIAPPGQPDVAFLKIARPAGNFPKPMQLSTRLEQNMTIAAIGYPARDGSIDEKKVIQIFGHNVYDKKRLSPGLLKAISNDRLAHDCSTTGGSSGSMLIDLRSGEIVGLHQGGLIDDSTNLGVPSTYLRTLLNKVINTRTPAFSSNENQNPSNQSLPVMSTQENTGSFTFKLNIPVEITVKVGTPVYTQSGTPSTIINSPVNSFETALSQAKEKYNSMAGVSVRPGYRFERGWITDEKVIVLEVDQANQDQNFEPAIGGTRVEVRRSAPPDIVDRLNIDLMVLERPGKPAGYKEPEGYDQKGSDMYLGRVKRRMSAIFHVSPDAGFEQLSAFFSRIKNKLTATIYEWEPNHISDSLAEALQAVNGELKMVTQRTGVGEGDATISAVEDMQNRLGNKFEHVWASTRGANRLIPNSYHIKVASRDGEEFWLSSGNWKDSNQPKKANTQSVLTKNNREWHAIVSDPELAQLFQRYIEYDFEQAENFPTEIKEALRRDIELFVPELGFIQERVPDVTYRDTLTIEDEILDIHPLLTPDRDADGDPMFLKAAIEMIESATESILLQNQSFNLTEKNNKEFDRFFEVLRKKQRAVKDMRIIFRDAADYGRKKDLEKQQKLIEILKDFKINVSPNALRVQRKCHTKAIIVDSKQVLLGSQNLTNLGALFNRDASLLVRSAKVGKFFEDIFNYDWEHLAHNNITEVNERVSAVREAKPGEDTPAGFRRVKLSDFLAERE